LGAIRDTEAILIADDLARMTDAADPMERRLVRLASHYRQRALMAEDALDDVVMADDLPGDHCEMKNAVEFARRVLAQIPKS
jgi:hypothetical protein